ncbi:MAG: glycosyltransferase family 39 protein [Planctomycetes bacterium]|nr:glycosyltransferase family 39 protein [Planctomycetota bacterium]
MSKPTQKHKRSRNLIDPHKHNVSPPAHQADHWPDSAKLLSSKPVLVFIIIAILAAIPFCMGKYFEFNSPGAFDSGAYVYSAKRILDGAKIGIDEKPSAQMGTLLVNMLGVKMFGFGETGPKLIQAILQAAALVLMFIAIRKLFGTLPAAVGVIIASIYLSAPLMAKYGNVKEQHMIAFMVMGISCFVLYQLTDRFWLACLAGVFLSFAPLFKETGISAISAVGLFVIAQPLLKHRSWKKTGADILLLAAGAVVVISPICLWLSTQKAPLNYFPYYSFVGRPLAKLIQSPQEPNTAEATVQSTPVKQGLFMKFMPAYVRDSWKILKPEQLEQAKLRVFRWYRLLTLPIALALGSIIIRIIFLISRRSSNIKHQASRSYDRFVLLLAVWWLLDMMFVWISPRSYEQYYLPLNASAAMLGGYLIAIYHNKLKSTAYKPAWVITGIVGFILMIIASQHIFFGITKSAHSGIAYTNPKKRRGYSQKLNEISRNPQYPWMMVGQYINKNSTENDKIYVWGWVPGIYVAAQRLSPTPKAFEGTMHTLTPQVLSERVDEILQAFKKEPPKFIVDTHKRHFPWDRPPLELWPQAQKGFLPSVPQIVSQYDQMYANMLREQIEPAEALRYQAMKPFREYVMKNYKIVQPFGVNILFQRK